MKTFITWLKKQNEYLPLLVAVLLFIYSPPLLRKIDATAGVFDIGILQTNIITVISYSIFMAVVWMTIKVNWPRLRAYFENEFLTDFNTLEPWQKLKLSLAVYFLLLLSIVLLSRAI